MDSLIHIGLPANGLCMRKTNITGKPYAGKPHVRFDEGAEERLSAPRLYSTGFLTLLYFLKGERNEISGYGFGTNGDRCGI